MSQLSTSLNQRKSGTLPSDTVQNLWNDGSCMAITTRSGKILPGIFVGKSLIEDMIEVKNEPKDECSMDSEKLDGADDAL